MCAGQQGEDGAALGGVRGYGDEVGAVGPGDGGLKAVEDPVGAVAARGDGEFGGVVAGTSLGGGGEDDFAAAHAGEQFGCRPPGRVPLDGHRDGAGLQEGDAGEDAAGFAQYEAEGDGVETAAAVLGGDGESQQVGGGETGPERSVEVLGDGARCEGGARYRVGRDAREDRLGRLDGRLLLFGEGEVHCPALPLCPCSS